MKINKLTTPSTSKGVEVAQSVNALIDSVGDKRVVIKDPADWPDVIDSSVEYFIDGVVDMGYRSIVVPPSGINISGYNFDLSKLISSHSNYTMFISPDGGSGNFLGKDYGIEVTGEGSSVYNLTSATGFEAFEFQRINYNGCTSLGIISNYRQGLESGTGRFGGSPDLTIAGNWNGFRIETSIVRNIYSGTVLFKAGNSLVFSGRFITNMNLDLPAVGSFCDFSDSNFLNDESFLIQGAFITRQGVVNAKDANITPGITNESIKSNWQNNTGIGNTNKYIKASCSASVPTPIPGIATYYPLLGTFTVSRQVHFDMPANGEFRLLTGTGDYLVGGDLVISGTANNNIGVRVVRSTDGGATFTEEVSHVERVINNLAGGRDVAFVPISFVTPMDKGDRLRLEVENYTSASALTMEIDSFITISEI